MLLKLNWYKSKFEYYKCSILTVIPMVTEKKIDTEYIQKEMRDDFKCLQKINTKEDRSVGNEGRTSYKTYRKQIGT